MMLLIYLIILIIVRVLFVNHNYLIDYHYPRFICLFVIINYIIIRYYYIINNYIYYIIIINYLFIYTHTLFNY
jgi:hypothetical protein